jgi:tetratricopeptide (TPR) repeat protein
VAGELGDSSPEALFRQTLRKLIESGHVQEAEKLLQEKVDVQGESPESLFLEGLILSKQRQFVEAIKTLQRSLAMDPRDSEVHKQLALNAIIVNRLDIAEPALKTAIQLTSNDFMAHFHLGLLYYTTNRFSLAESELKEVVKLNPAYMKGYEFLAVSQEELENDDIVIDSYHKAIELTEHQHLKDESPYLRLAKFLWLRNRFEESLSPARRAVELNARSAESYYVLGRLLDKLGQEGEALRALHRSLQIDPNLGEPHYLLSRIYLRQGLEQQAQQEMQIFADIKRVESNQEGQQK